MQTSFAKLLIRVLILASLLVAGCSPEPVARDEGNKNLACFDVRDGYGVPLCSTSFTRLLAQPTLFHGRYVALKAVLSIEFDSCVLHRDFFSSENYLDLESLVIEDQSCLTRAKNVLGKEPAKLVSVVGRYEDADKANVERAGRLIDLRVLEAEIAIGR